MPAKTALIRMFILLLIVCAVAFAWEFSKNSNLQPATGRVIAHEYRDYTIRYSVLGKSYQFVTRRGLLDFLGDLKSLQLGDEVPVLVSSESPHKSVVNTLSGQYGITLTFATLMLLFAVVIAISMIRRNGSDLYKKR